MFCVIIIIINLNLFLQSSLADNPEEFRINVTSAEFGANSFDVSDMPIVKQNQRLDIIFMNYPGDVNDVRCKRRSEGYYFDTNFRTLKIDNTPCLKITVMSITNDMSSKWGCEVSFNDRGEERQHTIFFRIHVKGAKPVIITINDKPFLHAMTQLSVRDHDGFGIYRFEPGEAIYVNCGELDKNALLVLRYESTGGKVIESKRIYSKELVFYNTVLTENNDNDIVDCTYISKDEMKYTYRTMFKRKFQSSPDSSFEISVNNLKLAPADKSEDMYQYKFYDDEEVQVTCEKKDINDSGNLIFGHDDGLIRSRGVKVTKDAPWKISIKCKAKHFQNKHLQCLSDNAMKKKANILFIPGTTEPQISGLSPSDLQYEYSYSNTTWFAHYWYSTYQTINLTCTTRLDDTELVIFINNTKVKQDVNYINHQLYLNNTYDGIPIECTSQKGENLLHTGIIILHKKPMSPDFRRDDDDQIKVLIIGGALIAVLITLVVICVICWCRAKGRHDDLKIPYKKETQEPQMPKTDSSRQENHSVNCDTDFMVENSLYNGALYAIPIKKDKVAEYHYIEVDDVFIKKQKHHKENIAKQRVKEPASNAINVKNEDIESVDYVKPYAVSSKANDLAVKK